mmetsp:Transcript_8078/g.18749  ORF Transcript_8078/g.18749 Transcript_8078/m.18749 type:complete len:312 (+) Transcript_8078:466-1401(+)
MTRGIEIEVSHPSLDTAVNLVLSPHFPQDGLGLFTRVLLFEFGPCLHPSSVQTNIGCVTNSLFLFITFPQFIDEQLGLAGSLLETGPRRNNGRCQKDVGWFLVSGPVVLQNLVGSFAPIGRRRIVPRQDGRHVRSDIGRDLAALLLGHFPHLGEPLLDVLGSFHGPCLGPGLEDGVVMLGFRTDATGTVLVHLLHLGHDPLAVLGTVGMSPTGPHGQDPIEKFGIHKEFRLVIHLAVQLPLHLSRRALNRRIFTFRNIINHPLQGLFFLRPGKRKRLRIHSVQTSCARLLAQFLDSPERRRHEGSCRRHAI